MATVFGDATLTSERDRWIAEAKAGSSAALDKLLVLIGECLEDELGDRRVPGLSPSRSGADLIQDTVMVVQKKFPRFKRKTFGELKVWARGILHKRRMHCMRTHRRRTGDAKKQRILDAIAFRRSLPSQERPKKESADPIEQRDDWERVLVALRRLKPRQHYVLRLRFFDDMTFALIASLVNSTEVAVSKTYQRALADLRRMLNK
jgi:RNA polymerase sigma factor (sigma-70 family)